LSEGDRKAGAYGRTSGGLTRGPMRRAEAEPGKLQGPFTDSVPSRYNSCFSIYTRERWALCEKPLS
jgi:hypothetical protein